ncbi:hypothetical protein JXA40_00685 [bacterium]|nr:hypothetical protein [candidate division CSSED10-310 bacterium]
MKRMGVCCILVVSMFVMPAAVMGEFANTSLEIQQQWEVREMLRSTAMILQMNQLHGASAIIKFQYPMLFEQPARPDYLIREGRMGLLKPDRIRSPLSWEYSASLIDANLYALYTAADLGGYGDNLPPYEPSGPNPPDGATNVALDVTLQWTGGDPNSEDTVSYDIYFGTDSNPPLVATDHPTNTYTPSTQLDPDTLYYWKIVSRDNWGAETEGPVWSFTTLINYPPNQPVNPIPPDDAVDVDVNADLSWQCNDPNPGDTLEYDVYFGTSADPPLVMEGVTSSVYDPGAMNAATMYYWKIVARDNWGAETEGPVWSFTTSSGGTNNPPYMPGNPYPPNGATQVNRNADLSWEGGDPDPGDVVVYDVYFGTSSPPPLEQANVTGTTYEPGTMPESTQHYWKIVARDDHQAQTEGPIWSFTTGTDAGPTPTPTASPEPCDEYEVQLDMGGNYFCPGDTCYVNARICNPEEPRYLPLFIILDIANQFWFAPSWSMNVDYYLEVIPSDWSDKVIISTFVWPEGAGSNSGIIFWGALTNPEISEIIGQYAMYEFGYGPCD